VAAPLSSVRFFGQRISRLAHPVAALYASSGMRWLRGWAHGMGNAQGFPWSWDIRFLTWGNSRVRSCLSGGSTEALSFGGFAAERAPSRCSWAARSFPAGLRGGEALAGGACLSAHRRLRRRSLKLISFWRHGRRAAVAIEGGR